SETGAIGAKVGSTTFQTARQNLGNGLTDAELAAIRIFSGGDYKYMNAVLSGSRERVQEGIDKLSGKDPETTWGIRQTKAHFDQGGTLDKRQLRDLRKEAMQHSRLAQAGLAKLPDVVTDGYRGMSLAKTQLDAEYQVGNVVSWPGFNSTSTDRAAADGKRESGLGSASDPGRGRDSGIIHEPGRHVAESSRLDCPDVLHNALLAFFDNGRIDVATQRRR
ncbi:MAG TPA: hypothetical protein VFZ25_19210, partial [Chloroflexota bacterium]|nr:hypothetical protein [Chloroflexota bacterium]